MATVQVKLSNGTQHPLTLQSLDITVAEFKKLAAPVIDIPAENQRIVFKGKVLKDVDNIQKVGVEAGLALHVVRSAAAPAAAPAPVPTPAPVVAPAAIPEEPSPATSSSAPAPPPNPFAAVFGGITTPQQSQAVGGIHGQQPAIGVDGTGSGMDGMGGWASMMGGMGGAGGMGAMGGGDPLAMLQNPMVMQMVSQMMQNPQYMQAMAANNPMLQGMSSQQRDQMMQLMGNPQIMQMALQMMANGGMGGMGGGVGGGMGGAQQQPNFNAMAQAMGQMNANSANMQQFLAPPPVQGNPRELYRAQLEQLANMGFPNEQANIAALQMSQGNVEFAIERLLNSGGGGGW